MESDGNHIIHPSDDGTTGRRDTHAREVRERPPLLLLHTLRARVFYHRHRRAWVDFIISEFPFDEFLTNAKRQDDDDDGWKNRRGGARDGGVSATTAKRDGNDDDDESGGRIPRVRGSNDDDGKATTTTRDDDESDGGARGFHW